MPTRNLEWSVAAANSLHVLDLANTLTVNEFTDKPPLPSRRVCNTFESRHRQSTHAVQENMPCSPPRASSRQLGRVNNSLTDIDLFVVLIEGYFRSYLTETPRVDDFHG